MVIGQAAHIQTRGLQRIHMTGVHAVVDAFGRPRVAVWSDGGFQIDQAQVGLVALDFGQGFAPDVLGGHRMGNAAVHLFCQFDVLACVTQPAFVELGAAGVGHDLVDTAPSHHIPRQPHREVLVARGIRGGVDSGQGDHVQAFCSTLTSMSCTRSRIP